MWLSVKAPWPFQCQPLNKEGPSVGYLLQGLRAGPGGASIAPEAEILAQPLGPAALCDQAVPASLGTLS